jgi:endonuclease YncB( thermonuclease family)
MDRLIWRLVIGQVVTVLDQDIDRYGRIVARLTTSEL